MKFDPEYLRRSLEPVSHHNSFLIGLSGGMDSISLLYAMAQLVKSACLSASLRAVHINHGLHAESDHWQQVCENTCKNLHIELHCEKVNIGSGTDENSTIENLAREARYQVYETQLGKDEILLLAHHLDDQLETLLFRLNRGASLKGLASIPQRRKFGAGEIFRPLLDVSRTHLLQFAQEQGLKWVEDTSNTDTQFDRNYLRHEILPAIESRWPGYRASWHKSLQLISEANEMLTEIADVDLDTLQTDDPSALSIEALQQLSGARQRNAIRRWIEKSGLPDLGWNLLQQLINEFASGDGEEGLFAAEGYSLGRYQKQLHLVKTLPAPVQKLDWQPLSMSEITIAGCGKLTVHESSGRGLAKQALAGVDIRFRQGGESCQLTGRPRKSLKKILQEAHIAPWWRQRIPLIYRDEELVCIPGIGVSETAAAGPNEPGIELHWQHCEN